MNKDIRININFFEHPKTVKLKRKLGDKGVLCLQRLWCSVAANKPDGLLTDMDYDDIEIAAKWDGEQFLFVRTLIELRWLDAVQSGEDEINTILSVHDWEEHNGFAYHAQSRSDLARRAVNARWDKYRKEQEQSIDDTERIENHTERIRNEYGAYTDGIRTVIRNDTDSNTERYG